MSRKLEDFGGSACIRAVNLRPPPFVSTLHPGGLWMCRRCTLGGVLISLTSRVLSGDEDEEGAPSSSSPSAAPAGDEAR